MTKKIIYKQLKTLVFKLDFHGSLKDIKLISIAYDIDCRDSFYFEFVLIGFWLRIHSINF